MTEKKLKHIQLILDNHLRLNEEEQAWISIWANRYNEEPIKEVNKTTYNEMKRLWEKIQKANKI